MARLSDRGFTSSRGLSYTFSGTATELDTALPITHNLGALPSSLELWVEVSAGQWEQHDAATYVTASTTALTATATTLASVVGGSTNVRLVAAAGAVALSVAEASVSQAGIVSTGTQSFGGIKAFGTSSATTLAPLHAKASSSFSLNLEEDASNVAGILFSRHASPNAGSVSITANSQSSGNYLAFTTGSGEALRIDSSGNVGIGISPSYALDVNQASPSNDNLFRVRSDTSGGAYISWNRVGTSRFSQGFDSGSGTFRFRTGGEGSTGTEVGNITSAGAWTLGPSGTTEHLVNGALKVKTTGATASLLFAHNGDETNNWQIGKDNAGLAGTDGFYFYSYGIPGYVGGISTAGAWTLGPSSGAPTHDIYGGFRFPNGGNATGFDYYGKANYTPTLPNGGTLTNTGSRYIRIGNMCTVTFYIQSINPTANTNEFRVSLPFTAASSVGVYWVATIGYTGTADSRSYRAQVAQSTNYVYFHNVDGSTGLSLTNNNWISTGITDLIVTVTYETA